MRVVDSLWHDLRLGVRTLRKQPGVSAIAILALALGLGLTTTMFSIINGILLRGLPFPEPHQLYAIGRTSPTQDDPRASIRDVADWRDQQKAFDGIAGYSVGAVTLSGPDGGAELASGAFVTPNLFRVLRQPAALGRTLADADGAPGSPPVIVLGDAVWRRRYGADPDILTKTVRANGEEMQIIGVMPARFRFPDREELWLPLRDDPLRTPRGDDGANINVFGRLRPDLSAGAAQLEFATIARRLADAYPTTNRNVGTRIEPLIDTFVGREPKAMLYAMLGAVFGVLLIACFNVANLLLARAAVRTREVAIRAALGGARWRVVSQMLVETLILAAFGSVLGLSIARLGVTLFNRTIAGDRTPFWVDIRIDPVVLAFVAAVTILSAIAAGIVPALQASGGNLSDGLKDESRGSSSFRMGRISRTLVIAELAASCGLLVGAGLMTKSVVQLSTFAYGFATDDVLTARILLGWPNASTGAFETDYPARSPRRHQFWVDVVSRVQAEPGVLGASLTSELPGRPALTFGVAIEGKTYADERDETLARRAVIAPQYFATYDVRVLEGREFLPSDGGAALPVAIVNQSFARRYGPAGGSALGMRFREGIINSREPWRTVVGVVPDMFMAGNDSSTLQGYYTPLAQADRWAMNLVVRARGDPLALTKLVRRDVAAIDPDVPLYNEQTQRQLLDERSWRFRVFGSLFIVFGAVALFLASLGLYGVMSFAVSRRTHEVGVRMALGATRMDVLRLFLRQGLTQIGIGVAIGLLLAFILANSLSFVLFRVNARDPVVFGAIATLLIVVGIVACLMPARRATRVDPLVALRYD